MVTIGHLELCRSVLAIFARLKRTYAAPASVSISTVGAVFAFTRIMCLGPVLISTSPARDQPAFGLPYFGDHRQRLAPALSHKLINKTTVFASAVLHVTLRLANHCLHFGSGQAALCSAFSGVDCVIKYRRRSQTSP